MNHQWLPWNPAHPDVQGLDRYAFLGLIEGL
jgi:hypothetical protein